jgi:hypothetical protein
MPAAIRVLTLACVGALFVAGCKDPPADAAATSGRRPRAAVTGKTESVGHVSWGTDGGSLTKNVVEEAAPVGPSAFVVDAVGKAHVLDRASSRIQVFEDKNGRWTKTKSVTLPEGDYLDLELDGSGYVLLDTEQREAVTFVDGAGKELATVRLSGAHIPEVGHVKALRRRGEDVWVQLANNDFVRVAQAKTPAADRAIETGLVSPSGKRLLPVVKRPNDVRVGFLSDAGVGALATLSFDSPVAGVAALELGRNGQTYVVATLEDEQGNASNVLVVLDAKGDEVVRANLEADDSGLGVNRPIRVGEDGKLYQMQLTDDGVDFSRFVQ